MRGSYRRHRSSMRKKKKANRHTAWTCPLCQRAYTTRQGKERHHCPEPSPVHMRSRGNWLGRDIRPPALRLADFEGQT